MGKFWFLLLVLLFVPVVSAVGVLNSTWYEVGTDVNSSYWLIYDEVLNSDFFSSSMSLFEYDFTSVNISTGSFVLNATNSTNSVLRVKILNLSNGSLTGTQNRVSFVVARDFIWLGGSGYNGVGQGGSGGDGIDTGGSFCTETGTVGSGSGGGGRGTTYGGGAGGSYGVLGDNGQGNGGYVSSVYGTGTGLDLSVGSGGGGGSGFAGSQNSNNYGKGGSGGGALWLKAPFVDVHGVVNVSGQNGDPGRCIGSQRAISGGGGGSGGGILIEGGFCNVSNSVFDISGGGIGNAGSCSSSSYCSDMGYGGSGGGGRIKFRCDDYDFTNFTVIVDGGSYNNVSSVFLNSTGLRSNIIFLSKNVTGFNYTLLGEAVSLSLWFGGGTSASPLVLDGSSDCSYWDFGGGKSIGDRLFYKVNVSNSSGYFNNFTLDFNDVNCPLVPIIRRSDLFSNQYPVLINSTLLGYCNSSDVNNDTINYTYKFFKDGVLNLTGSFNDSLEGISVNVGNVSGFSFGESWLLECQAFDVEGSSSARNSSAVEIISSGDYGVPVFVGSSNVSKAITTLQSDSFNVSVNNTGNFSLSGCNMSLGGDFVGQDFVSFNVSGFDVDVGVPVNVRVDLINPVSGVFSGFLNMSCVINLNGDVSQISGFKPLVYLVVVPGVPTGDGGGSSGGGGGGDTVVVVSGDGEDLFKLTSDRGGANPVLLFYPGQSRRVGILLESLVSRDLTVGLSCQGDFCRNVLLEKNSVSLLPGNQEVVWVDVMMPEGVLFGESYSFDLVASSGVFSGKVVFDLSVSQVSVFLSKFDLVVSPGEPGYLFTLGGFNVPKVLFYFLVSGLFAGGLGLMVPKRNSPGVWIFMGFVLVFVGLVVLL